MSTNAAIHDHDKLLKDIYYDIRNPAGYASRYVLFRAAKQQNKNLTLNDVKEWLRRQETYTLHRSARRRFPRRKTISKGLNWQWQIDLVDMSKYSRQNAKNNYILTGIDVFSRYAFAEPVHRKTGIDIARALKTIFTREQRVPKLIQSDLGREFFNKNVDELLNSYRIKLFAVHSDTKASLVERFNRTLKTRMFRYFTAENTTKYVDVLQTLVSAYNASKHRILGMTPIEVTPENEADVWKRLYSAEFPRKAVFRYQIGDKVRIRRFLKTFDKSYLPMWTREYFTITQQRATKPVTYKIKDLDEQLIKGSFYNEGLQLVNPENDYQIDVLKSRKLRSGRRIYYVHFRGWPDSHDQWIEADQMRSL